MEQPTDFLLSRATRSWRRLLDLELRPQGVTYATWVTLAYLRRGGDGLLQKDLAQLLAIEAPTLVRMLDRLEREGLVDRRPVESDRRAKTVHLTPEAHKVLGTFDAIAGRMREHLLAGISNEELATTHQVLTRIVANAEQHFGSEKS